MGVPFALDFGAVIAVGSAQGVDVEMLTEAMPAAEAAIIERYSGEGEAGAEEA